MSCAFRAADSTLRFTGHAVGLLRPAGFKQSRHRASGIWRKESDKMLDHYAVPDDRDIVLVDARSVSSNSAAGRAYGVPTAV